MVTGLHALMALTVFINQESAIVVLPLQLTNAKKLVQVHNPIVKLYYFAMIRMRVISWNQSVRQMSENTWITIITMSATKINFDCANVNFWLIKLNKQKQNIPNKILWAVIKDYIKDAILFTPFESDKIKLNWSFL